MESKKYLEIIDIDESDFDNVQIEVEDKSDAEVKLVEEEKKPMPKKYIARYHICRHGEHGKNWLCEVEILKEVK